MSQVLDSGMVINDSMGSLDSVKSEVITVEQDPTSKELAFIHYLVSNELYGDAQYSLNALEQDSSILEGQKDSIEYFQGWLSYYQRDFDNSLNHFNQIDKQSELLVASQFFSVMCLLELGDNVGAEGLLNEISSKDRPDIAELKILYQSGFALLKRDYAAYDSLVALYKTNNYLIAAERTGFDQYANDLRVYKDKSPLVAGLLSALVPGLGKYYAGYKGHPFGALAITLPFAAPAIELAILAGLTSPLFIASGALFGLFYFGNIWGSALSVKTHKSDYYGEIDYNIVIDLHVPLRRVF